jgi:hypothetical protein
MAYRVVQWSTGNVGRHTLAGIDAHPDLDLVGVFVSNPDKVGKDAGELAGLGHTLGVTGSSDVDALLALRPDCIVHTAMADDRIFEALADLERFLAAGINVVSSSPVMLQYPAPDDPIAAPVIAAAERAGVPVSRTTRCRSSSRASASASRRSGARRSSTTTRTTSRWCSSTSWASAVTCTTCRSSCRPAC